jgi:hypothetical protein
MLILCAEWFGVLDPAFWNEWKNWVWTAEPIFIALTVTRAVTAYYAYRKAVEARHMLQFVPLDHPWPLHRSWWHFAKHQDGSLVSQISMDLAVTNLSDYPARITKVCLVKPKREQLDAHLTVSMAGSRYYSYEHPILPHTTVEAHLHISIRGELARQGKPIRTTFGFTDQFGCEYRLRRVLIPADDPKLPHSMKEVTLDELLRLARK